jgi:DNA-binding transcriptional LysR family regulator
MEMHQVRYFLALCEELNFTRAAKRCGVAQPSLTNAIKSLEQELGGALFQRGRGNIRLSELGRVVQPCLKALNRCAQQAKRKASDFTSLESSTRARGGSHAEVDISLGRRRDHTDELGLLG